MDSMAAVQPMGHVNSDNPKVQPPLQNMKTQFDRKAMLAEMGDIGYGSYGDNYSEFARQPAGNLEENKEENTVVLPVLAFVSVAVGKNETSSEWRRLSLSAHFGLVRHSKTYVF